MTHSVAVCSAPDYTPAVCEAAVEKLFAALPCTAKLGPDTRILLKPNLLAKAAPDRAVTTHPEVVRAVIHACLRRGARKENITVADSPGGLYNPLIMKNLYQISGLSAVCECEGVLLYTDCESQTVSVKNSDLVREFDILRPVIEADFIIDLAKLKTHVMTGLTAACKNLFGTIPGLRKAELHTRFPDKALFGRMLIDLLETVQPDMAIVDAVVGLEGDGPNGGEPRPLGLMLAGEDLPNLDLACAELIGLDPMRVPYLSAAHARDLCAAAFDRKDLCLEPEAFASVLPTGWRLPSSFTSGSGANTDFAAKRAIPAALQPLVQKAEAMIAPHPVVNRARCIGCGKCAEICPQHTIVMKDRKSRILPKNCIRCFCCHEMCPVKAIDVKQLKIFKL